MQSEVTIRLITHLDNQGAKYRIVEHEATHTSEESAKARGEDIRIGAKALLLKLDQKFQICVLSAALKLDSKAVKKITGAKDCRFASKEELLELTGLVPGSLPPFGAPIMDFELIIDKSIAELDRVAFNAGSLTTSVIMDSAEYLRVADGTLSQISQPI